MFYAVQRAIRPIIALLQNVLSLVKSFFSGFGQPVPAILLDFRALTRHFGHLSIFQHTRKFCMPKLLMIALLLVSFSILFAAEADPVQNYLRAPGLESFQAVLSHLNSQINAPESSFRARLYLSYICDKEAGRVLDGLVAEADSLAPGERFSLANYLLGKEDYESAVMLYNAINRDLPDWSCPWRHKGEALYRMGDYQASASSLFEAIATNADHYDAYIWMAKAQKELGLYQEALANLDKAKTLSPEEEESPDEEITQQEIDKLYEELQSLLR